jgi:hypothetical protein
LDRPYTIEKTDTGYKIGWDYLGPAAQTMRWAAEEAVRRGYAVTVRSGDGTVIAMYKRNGNVIILSEQAR